MGPIRCREAARALERTADRADVVVRHRAGALDPALRRILLDAYGLARPNPAKLRFHLALDELF